MTIVMHPRACANPGCRRPLPPAQPGHKARLTCGDRCRKAASRLRKQEVVRRQEEAARLAEELAEAIRSERTRGGASDGSVFGPEHD